MSKARVFPGRALADALIRDIGNETVHEWYRLVEHYVYRIEELRQALDQMAAGYHPETAKRALEFDNHIRDEFERRVSPPKQSKPK